MKFVLMRPAFWDGEFYGQGYVGRRGSARAKGEESTFVPQSRRPESRGPVGQSSREASDQGRMCCQTGGISSKINEVTTAAQWTKTLVYDSRKGREMVEKDRQGASREAH
ncbi:hypothetical protein HIM_10746 [Hirsutella minnesotensis 3608]|uniref:Uncharacterized protein n=1 Tax=Hirsutella minnesotensis 3608 TaxID=1043627 RepID=A0A0F7ZX03_9HYPO|nr:hypothetical protein HIM_10746 [Hirsutella minnesotensis 3608]